MKVKSTLILSTLALLLSACGSDNNSNDSVVTPPPTPDTSVQFEVSVTNLTHNQPLSPIAVAAHTQGSYWQLGEPSSEALELLAESGDNTEFLAAEHTLTAASDSAPLPAGDDTLVLISAPSIEGLKLTVATMLVNTNDAFAGLNAIDVSHMSAGQTLEFSVFALDAGTEANTEALGTIPGPADGGEGFNTEREALNKITVHSGVISAQDGLASSILNASHRFDNPVALIEIERVQ